LVLKKINKYLQIYDNIFTKEECDKLIKHFDSSKVKFIDRGIAEYYRLEEDSDEMANMLWSKIKGRLPRYYDKGELVCLNTHFRYSKYKPGMEFGRHRDGTNQDQNGYRNIITFNIFLNDTFDGGETDFFDDNGNLILSAKPKPGRAALFDSQILHCGNKVLNGCKYLLRTDVMLKTN
jgi:predicted 2-oxoglutarate/Fe(II)-dependent dioxygenase YbiX